MTTKVDAYYANAKKWKEELSALREIALASGMTEELKWGKPCYTVNGGNVMLVLGFKDYCSLMLMKGALLTDAKNMLIAAGENTQSTRQMRFTSIDEIRKAEKTIKAYVKEAVAVEKAGLKVTPRKISEQAVPDEFKARLEKSVKLKKAFGGLTPGRQRAYLMYFASAKQSKTRETRIEKYLPQILAGKGLDD